MKALAFSAGGFQINPPEGVPTVGANSLLWTAVSFLILLAIIICLLTLLYGGYRWIISEGRKESIDQARNQIIFAGIGLILAFVSFFFVNILSAFFGVDLLNSLPIHP